MHIFGKGTRKQVLLTSISSQLMQARMDLKLLVSTPSCSISGWEIHIVCTLVFLRLTVFAG
jgi:hypothetical protein